MAAETFSSDVLRSKFRGCMVGALLGDCLGSPFEFSRSVAKETINEFFGKLMSKTPLTNIKGDWFVDEGSKIVKHTDDTAMTISIASSIIDKGEIDAEDLAKRFTDEYFREPRRGYGTHVQNVFRALRESNFADVYHPATLQFDGSGSYGNGAAMRIAPVALFGNRRGEQFVMEAAKESARITHTHPHGINGGILQALAVNAALGLDPSQDFDPINFIDNLLEKMENLETENMMPYCERLKTIRDIFLHNPEDISPKEITKSLGNGRDESGMRSVPTAIYSFLRGMKPLTDFESNSGKWPAIFSSWKRIFHIKDEVKSSNSSIDTNPFMKTLFFVISLGGDTDTIGSMALAIAGAYYGVDMIPEVLQKRCESIDGIIKLADALFDVTQKKE